MSRAMDTTIDDLATMLFAFEPGPRSTRVVTSDLTRAIVRWALAHGWAPRPEARIEVPKQDARHRLGFVDVLVDRGLAGPCLAIEIDSTDKEWSLSKLRYAAAAGMVAVWVRWGDDEWAGSYAEVDVIQLPARRRAARSPSSAQLALWS